MLSFLNVNAQSDKQPIRGVPACPKVVLHTEADGNVVEVIQRGDASFNWLTTKDGYTILKNSKGYFEFAKKTAKGKLVPSGVRCKAGTAADKFKKSVPKNLKGKKPKSKSNFTNGISFTGASSASSGINPAFSPTGTTNKLLVILANFKDTDTTYRQRQLKEYVEKVKIYYEKNSYGKFSINAVVTAWVTLPQNHDYYSPDRVDPNTFNYSRYDEFAYDAIFAADQAGVDFSQFDNDGDGNAESIAIIHQGRGQEESHDQSDIWSHAWSITEGNNSYSDKELTFDNKKVDDYIAIPEMSSATAIATIGVFCHEFGHALGLPDFYDTDGSDNGQYNGTGKWDVMAGGSWNGSPNGSSPANHTAWSKIALGWLTPTVITGNGTYALYNSAEETTECQAYIIHTKDTEYDEYFLLENRQEIEYDSKLPGHGMLIYRVTGYIINNYPSYINTDQYQGLYPICASATGNAPEEYGTINSSSTPFPGTSNITSFTDLTTPNARSWDNEYTNLPVTGIREENQVIYFNVNAGTGLPIEDANIVYHTYCNGHNTSNYGSATEITAGFTPGSYCSSDRKTYGLLKMEMPEIPAGAIIESATLTLYPSVNSGSTESKLSMVTSNWSEGTVIYDTKPYVSSNYTVSVPAQAGLAAREIDIMQIVEYWKQNPNKNYGLMLSLINESGSAKELSFYSSDFADTQLHPKLTITYSDNITTIGAVADAQINSSSYCNGTNTNRNDYKNQLFYAGHTPSQYCFSGGYFKGLMKFDFSNIDPAADIQTATLVLKGENQTGDNTSVLKKITSAWDQTTVTWNNQPTATASGQITIPEMIHPNSTVSINITNWVENWIANPETNNGFMLELAESTTLDRKMTFYSSNSTITAYQPRIILNLKSGSHHATELEQDEEVLESSIIVSVYPNPTNGIVSIKSKQQIEKITVFSISGSTVFATAMDEPETTIDLSAQPEGIYHMQIISGQQTISKQIIVKK